MSEKLRISTNGPLLVVLQGQLPSWSRKKLKERLRLGCVTVNGAEIRQHDFAVTAGDELQVLATSAGTVPHRRAPTRQLATLFRDDDFIAIDKPAGLLSVSTTREKHKTALARVRQALGPKARLWPVHRLDRETSGVLMFATSKEACDGMQALWGDAEKVYLAVVQGRVRPQEGVVDTALWEGENLRIHTGLNPPSHAKEARSRFKVLERRNDRTLVEVRLDTGRKHQIRVHLSSIGHPVVGDSRYGERDARMGLHAARLMVTHPLTGDRLDLSAEPPELFNRLLR